MLPGSELTDQFNSACLEPKPMVLSTRFYLVLPAYSSLELTYPNR